MKLANPLSLRPVGGTTEKFSGHRRGVVVVCVYQTGVQYIFAGQTPEVGQIVCRFSGVGGRC